MTRLGLGQRCKRQIESVLAHATVRIAWLVCPSIRCRRPGDGRAGIPMGVQGLWALLEPVGRRVNIGEIFIAACHSLIVCAATIIARARRTPRGDEDDGALGIMALGPCHGFVRARRGPMCVQVMHMQLFCPPTESMANKKVAVDASIWLMQFLRAMR